MNSANESSSNPRARRNLQSSLDAADMAPAYCSSVNACQVLVGHLQIGDQSDRPLMGESSNILSTKAPKDIVIRNWAMLAMSRRRALSSAGIGTIATVVRSLECNPSGDRPVASLAGAAQATDTLLI